MLSSGSFVHVSHNCFYYYTSHSLLAVIIIRHRADMGQSPILASNNDHKVSIPLVITPPTRRRPGMLSLPA